MILTIEVPWGLLTFNKPGPDHKTEYFAIPQTMEEFRKKQSVSDRFFPISWKELAEMKFSPRNFTFDNSETYKTITKWLTDEGFIDTPGSPKLEIESPSFDSPVNSPILQPA